MKKLILIALACTFTHLPSSLFAATAPEHMTDQLVAFSFLPIQSTNGLLIILDDGEQTDGQFVGAGVTVCAQAISEKASPLIVSASIIAQLYQDCTAAELIELEKRLHELEAIPIDTLTKKDTITYKKLFASLRAQLNTQTAHEWIVKEINPSLYLLLHESYLAEKKIPLDAVTEYHDQAPLTPVEMQLGLKVNHMKTVKAAAIKKPTPEPRLADYFTEALRKNSLFVTNAEYTQEFSQHRSLWSIFIVGHGLMHTAVAGIALDEFKDFLSFLENKISTKLLYYVSCFGAGENNSRLYKDTEEGVDKIYPFAIITQALTDAMVFIKPLTINFTNFLQQATTSDCINYRELATCIIPDLGLVGSGSVPQVKFPGLEWFSVIDESKVVSIGSVLAKTRTEPLDIGTFFKKKGEQARPLAILLYTRDIPFELRIDSSGTADWPPHIISMIPGKAFHTLKKISSRTYSIDKLAGSISPLQGLGAHKTFVIGEIEGLFSTYMHEWLPAADKAHAGQDTIDSEKWAVIDRSNKDKQHDTFSFMYQGVLYGMNIDQKSSPVHPVYSRTTEDNYWLLIQKAIQQQPPLSEWAKQLFAQPIFDLYNPSHFAHHAIAKIFKIMPYGTELHLPLLNFPHLGLSTTLMLDDIAQKLCDIKYTNEGKSIHFDQLMVGNTQRATDLILHIGKDESYGEASCKEGTMQHSSKKACSSFDKYKKKRLSLPEYNPPVIEPSVEKKSTHEHTTQETMKALADTLMNKEKRKAWLQKFADTIKSDTESWIKTGAQWIKKGYKNTEHLALYYLQQRQLEKDALARKQPPTQSESSDSHTRQELDEVD